MPLPALRHRPFIAMWYHEDESDTVTFGEFIGLALSDRLVLRIQSTAPPRRDNPVRH
jgi:hypothetical protein